MGTDKKHIQGGVPKVVVYKLLSYLIEKRKTSPDTSISEPTIFQYYKNFQLMTRLRGKALCLLKTQFAKKPKNPE